MVNHFGRRYEFRAEYEKPFFIKGYKHGKAHRYGYRMGFILQGNDYTTFN
ncbi:hypothetical protein SAMN05216378_1824 [Paenibacillus catalpae]|uniref:Uncharacterized protein n=1 Tax=Paenibacillus catalpae TaxID=1045775 RepID=A0A1I1WWJ6_9BACL|nr:hypothetical protein SAMN05216378_1824 [Paenibacillus catalpae]